MKKLSSAGILLCVVFFLEQVHICFAGNSTSGCVEGERQALLKLKRSFEDPFNHLASWSGRDCCEWEGVSCNTSTGHVVWLDLGASYDPFLRRYSTEYISQYYLSAQQISSRLAELMRLEFLDLSGNDFRQSRIPDFIGSFKYLTYLNISSARLGGKIAHQLGNLTTLRVLDLSHNYEVYVNEFRWVSRLSSLQHLDMSGVYLGEALDMMPTLSKLPSLLRLKLNYCGIRNIHFSAGSVNSTFRATIQSLGLSGNELSGEIPGSIYNLTALKELDMGFQSNGFKLDSLLQWVSSLSTLQRLDMSRAGFQKTYHLFQPVDWEEIEDQRLKSNQPLRTNQPPTSEEKKKH